MHQIVHNSSLQQQKKTQRKTVLCMRQNLQELNRSMQSIEKMIERSRKILNHSKQKNKTQNNQTYRNDIQQYQQYQKAVTNNPQPKVTPINQKHHHQFSFQTRPQEFFILDKENQKKVQKIKTNNSGITKLSQNKTNHKNNGLNFNPYKGSPRNDQIKFKKTYQKQLKNNRMSSSKQKGLQSFKNKLNNQSPNKLKQKNINDTTKLYKTQTIKPQQKCQKIDRSKERFKEEIKYSYSPFLQKYQNGNKIYKFSPQKTNTHKKVPLVKLDLKAVNSVTTEKKSYETYNDDAKVGHQNTAKAQIFIQSGSDNIRIQDDQCLFNNDKGWRYFDNSIDLHGKNNPYAKESNEKEIRCKTQYKEENQCHMQQPKARPTIKKINLKRPINSDSKKDILISQRHPKTIQQNIHLSARLNFNKDKDNKQKQMDNLIKQLDELQTVSVDEDDRKKKFMMKIKKYGFVQKYLKQQQIWSIYNQLIDANVHQLKWPIFIVDEVYRRMKISHTA